MGQTRKKVTYWKKRITIFPPQKQHNCYFQKDENQESCDITDTIKIKQNKNPIKTKNQSQEATVLIMWKTFQCKEMLHFAKHNLERKKPVTSKTINSRKHLWKKKMSTMFTRLLCKSQSLIVAWNTNILRWFSQSAKLGYVHQ